MFVRKSAIFACLIVLASFVLTLLCLLAGTSPGFLDSYGMFTFNVSGLKTHADDFGSEDIAHLIRTDLSDVYIFHVRKFCGGNIDTTDGSTSVTSCMDLDDFDPLQNLSDMLDDGGHKTGSELVGIADTVVQVSRKLNVVSLAPEVVYYLYIVAVTLIGIALAAAIGGVFGDGKMSATLNVLIDLLAFAVTAVASALATFVAVTIPAAVNLVNNLDGDMSDGLSAEHGTGFLVLTWIATFLLFAASIAWCVACCSKRRHAARVVSPSRSAGTIGYQDIYPKGSSV